MVKVSGIRPHPAFDLSVLPSYRHGTAPHSALHEQKPTQKMHRRMHYPHEYLESLRPLDQSIDGICDAIAYVAMLAASWGSLLVAIFNPFWVLDSRHLNLGAFWDSPNETIFLRRRVVLEGLAWSHGLAVAYSGHLRSIMRNKAKLELVQPMLGEFQSHRVHMLSLLQALQPAIWTLALIIVLQAITLPVYFSICLVYPPMCHALAQFIGGLAIRLYSEALADFNANYMPHTSEMVAPPVAQWFYGLGPNAPFRDVLLCIRADDMFHAVFNQVCYECHCMHPTSAMEPYLDLDDARPKGQ